MKLEIDFFGKHKNMKTDFVKQIIIQKHEKLDMIVMRLTKTMVFDQIYGLIKYFCLLQLILSALKKIHEQNLPCNSKI